jgi:hypothetical protein
MWNTQAEDSRDRVIWWAGGLIVTGVIGIGVYYRYFSQPPAAVPQHIVQQHTTPPPPQEVEEAPVIEHPIPQGASSTPEAGLPSVNASDTLVRDSLAGFIGPKQVELFLVRENIIRHIVATVDNLPRKKVAVELRPLRATAGAAIVKTQGDVTTLSEQNYARYAPFIRIVKSIDPKILAGVYFRLYPLFQQAYEDLGYPGKYFNDRVVQAIDDMLKAPELEGPIELIQPKVFYELSDRSLEERSAGQKLLIRMGPANSRVIKEKLRALRAEVVKNKQE